MDDFALLRPSFYRPGGEGQLLHQRVTTALLRQFKAGGPSPRCSPAPRASVTYPARCMQHTWLRIRAWWEE